MLFTYFCFLLRVIYSALHRYMKLARYAGQLEVEKYVEQYFWWHSDIKGVLSFINGNMKFIDNFVCSIGNIFVKFYHKKQYLLYRILKYNDLEVIGM